MTGKKYAPVKQIFMEALPDCTDGIDIDSARTVEMTVEYLRDTEEDSARFAVYEFRGFATIKQTVEVIVDK